MVSLLNFGGARSTSQISGSLAGWDFGGICGILQPLGFDGFGGGNTFFLKILEKSWDNFMDDGVCGGFSGLQPGRNHGK